MEDPDKLRYAPCLQLEKRHQSLAKEYNNLTCASNLGLGQQSRLSDQVHEVLMGREQCRECPAGYQPRIAEKNMDFQGVESETV